MLLPSAVEGRYRNSKQTWGGHSVECFLMSPVAELNLQVISAGGQPGGFSK